MRATFCGFCGSWHAAPKILCQHQREGVGGRTSLGIEGVSAGGSLKVSVHVNFVCACEKCENF